MIVVILIGIPMWWKTTEVYRVSLPSGEILKLDSRPIKTAVKFGIFTFEERRSSLLIEELIKAFQLSENLWNITFEQIPINGKARDIKTPDGLESLILKEYPMNPGDFVFMEWPKLQEDVFITNGRFALIRTDTSFQKIYEVIDRIILQSYRIYDILEGKQSDVGKNKALQLEYDVVVSILSPQPEKMDVQWNIQVVVKTYIESFLQRFSQFSNYTLKTQWKYHLPFEIDWRQVRDTSKLGRHYALPDSSLPHIITSIERNLGVGITHKPAINLVVYIPPCDIAPVHIYNKDDKKISESNIESFISPMWGSIIIANPSTEACLAYMQSMKPISFYISTNNVMQVMLYNLYKLLDFSVEYGIDGVKRESLETISPCIWESDAYIRRNAITHIVSATNTLQSLIKLLDNISYIVINEEVGTAINEAYQNIDFAKRALLQNRLLDAAHNAKLAFAASERAFFDASLLAQLYFPDEQKYAIYIPLFLPIMVPVISSFSMLKTIIKLK